MEKTPNLGLHQWSAGDSFLRTDFNSDFSKIDTAVGGRALMVCGSYVGNAALGSGVQKISLPFTPKAVLVYHQDARYGITPEPADYFAIALASAPFMVLEQYVLRVVDKGFEAGHILKDPNTCCYPTANANSTIYLYLAWG